MRKNWPIPVILTLSFVTRFLFFGYPRETVSDEVHFGKFISGYFSHQYFFDIHPPLGKLLISAMGRLGGFKPGFAFAAIGEPFPDRTYLWLRFLPTLAGALLPIVLYFLARQLGISALGASAVALWVVFDNSMVVQSRFILLDSLLLLFGFSALLFYACFLKRRAAHLLAIAGSLAGLSLSVKWTGLTFLALILMLEAIRFLSGEAHCSRSLLRILGCLVLVPVAIYGSVFVIHLKLLYQSGPGDAFMTPGFQKTLQGSAFANDRSLPPMGLLERVKELNIAMYRANATLTAGHPYGSNWYSWPFMTRPIFYWVKNNSGPTSQAARIYFLGNPITWWGSTAATLYMMVNLLLTWSVRDRAPWRYLDKTALLLIAAYFLNLLPFIGINRVMFLYHYMSALIVAMITMAYLIETHHVAPLPTLDGNARSAGRDTPEYLPVNARKAFTVLIVLSIVAFLFFSPLTYGLPLTEKAYRLRVWLPDWK